MILRWITILLLLLANGAALADEPSNSAYVRLPLAQYNQLIEGAQTTRLPTGYALGNAAVTIDAVESEEKITATVNVRLAVTILEDKWTTVRILPPGTAVGSATIAGSPADLVTSPTGIYWSSKAPGDHQMQLSYRIDALRTKGGVSLAVPLPEAAAISLRASLPSPNLDVAVLPSAGVTLQTSGSQTIVTATVPSASGVHLSWRSGASSTHAISRAVYSGAASDDAVTWRGELSVQLFQDEPVVLELLPSASILNEVKLDGEPAPLMMQSGFFSTVVSGKGTHTVLMEFEVPIDKNQGAPRARFSIPRIPISRFELTLSGNKEVTVTPFANAVYRTSDEETVASFHLPMTDHVDISWSEAVPDEIKEEVRSNVTVVHTLVAEEGVLYGRAIAQYEATRGEVNTIVFESPADVQINRIEAPGGIIADWRVVSQEGASDRITVFLNRPLQGALPIDVHYDLSIVGKKDGVSAPLLHFIEVQRQRGMIALLSSKELTLKPLAEEKLTKVGENQLPPEIRQQIDKTVAHTYKYVEELPKLTVQAVKPDRKEGRFDAMVSTLVSLSDVTMKGAATIELNVKSGSIAEVDLVLPQNVNVLSLTAPSLRTHKLEEKDGQQRVNVQFTQDMEGHFRIETSYERIIADNDADLLVPTLKVDGAEVEQGRIAVEALSAVEVKAGRTEHLSSLEPSELPQQLVLKTTNPILLAYKYVQTDPEPQLGLEITRHKEIDVQAAAIDNAVYRTLLTADGLAVTSAEFMMRNSKEQFLRIKLPEGSRIWSAYVDGKPEKPALGTAEGGKEGTVLIKIINSTQGFPVQLIFQTPAAELDFFGILDHTLPRPDITVTHTRWDLYLPDDVSYGEPRTNMRMLQQTGVLHRSVMESELASRSLSAPGAKVIEPLRVSVPASGIRYSFEKLYANKTGEDSYVSIPFAAGAGEVVADGLVIAAAALLWLGLGMALLGGRDRLKAGSVCAGAGAVLLAVLVGYIGLDWRPAGFISAGAVAIVFGVFVKRMRVRRAQAQV